MADCVTIDQAIQKLQEAKKNSKLGGDTVLTLCLIASEIEDVSINDIVLVNDQDGALVEVQVENHPLVAALDRAEAKAEAQLSYNPRRMATMLREMANDLDPDDDEEEDGGVTFDGDGNVLLSDNGYIEKPEEDTGIIRRYDVHGNCEEVRQIGDDDWQEWADLFDVTEEDFQGDEEDEDEQE